MERGIIGTHERSTLRNMRSAMQGNVIRALVELITNADDSYIRLEEDDISHKGEISIHYRKDGYHGYFLVCDHAEGMAISDFRESFKIYGKATSGLKEGKRVRGYFGHGAKDALVTMINGGICSFKNGEFVNCKLFIEDEKPKYEIEEPKKATDRLRNKYGIEENGTVAYFEADPSEDITVPKFSTIHEQLANNFLLRKIMLNPERNVFLIDEDAGKKIPLSYKLPRGQELVSEDIQISTKKFGGFPIHINIWRADSELTQTGDDRHGGLLLIDEEDVVLGISLFKYNNEPLAARLYGHVKINGFRKLLEIEEPVLQDNREGLDSRHPFCKKVISKVEEYLCEQVKKERKRKRQELKSRMDNEERDRFRNAFKILNEIAELEAQVMKNLGEDPSDEIEDPPHGFCLYPLTAEITVGKQYCFELRINTEIVRQGSKIEVTSTNHKIELLTQEVRILPEDNSRIIQKYITIKASEANIEGAIIASTSDLETQANVFVIPEKEFLYSEGMVFDPESITLRPNKIRKVNLLVYIKLIEGTSEIRIKSDNESIHVSKQRIVVVEADAERHVVKYELEIWGDGVDQQALITAEYQQFMAILSVRVKDKKKEIDKGHKGMFSKPEYDPTPNPLQRTHYSSETGKVIIYSEFPSVKHYLGDYAEYKKTLPAQILISDMVAETCFFEIAKKKVENSGALLRPESKHDRIRRDLNELSRKYGKKVHEALVDQQLLEKAREI